MEQTTENKNFNLSETVYSNNIMISDRLKFLFSVLCFLFLLLYGAPKKFTRYRHNRDINSVRAVWLSGRTKVYQIEGENRLEIETRSAPIFFLLSSIVTLLSHTLL